MLFKWPVAKQWEQTFVKGIEAHADMQQYSTDSIVYLNRQKKTCVHACMYLLLPDLCTFIYCYLILYVAYRYMYTRTSRKRSKLPLDHDSNMWDECACALHPEE